MTKTRYLALFALLALVACGKDSDDKKPKAEAAEEAPGVTLKAEEAQSLGIITAPARAAQYRAQVAGYGIVTPLDQIAQVDADFLTAQATAAQSQAAANRARSLGTGEEAAVSREVVEAAHSKAAADQAALMLARRKSDAAFGAGAPWHDAARGAAIRARLASGATVLVRVTFPLGTMGSATPPTLLISRMGADKKTWTARNVWEAPADPSLPGRGFYALLDGSDLAQNEHVSAAVPVGAAQSGVSVPAKALVYGENEAWVYLRDKPDHFTRVPIDTAKATPDGYFVRNGVKAGDAIVTDGAGLLMARELNPSTEAGD